MTYTASYRRMLTRMGYYGYQNGLIYRHISQEDGWDSHLGKCRKFILKAVDLFKPLHITVLGSGWLLDFPLAELCERSVKISLVDVIHPPDVREQTDRLDNVELIEADATGGLIQEIWERAGRLPFFRKMRSFSGIMVPEFKPDFDTGLVISLNILTQLEARILAYLDRRAKVSEDELLRFRKEIQIKHINFLTRQSAVLITDYAELVTDRKGGTQTVSTLLADLPEPLITEEWIWNFDLHNSDYYTNRSTMKMVALAF